MLLSTYSRSLLLFVSVLGLTQAKRNKKGATATKSSISSVLPEAQDALGSTTPSFSVREASTVFGNFIDGSTYFPNIGSKSKGDGNVKFVSKKNKPKGTPKDDACDLSDVDDISLDIKSFVTNQISNGNPNMLVAHIGSLPSVCVRYLQPMFEENEAICNRADVATAICNSCNKKKCDNRRMEEIVTTATACLNQTSICQFWPMLMNKDDTCAVSGLAGIASSNSLKSNCPIANISSCNALTMPDEDFKSYLEGKSSTQLRSFIDDLDADIEAKTMPCGQLKSIALRATETGLFGFNDIPENHQIQGLAPLLPYLPMDVCKNVPIDWILEFSDTIYNVDFMCSAAKKKAKQLPALVSRELRRSKLTQGSQDTFCNTEDLDANSKVKAINKKASECEFKCGKEIVKTLVDNQNVNIETAEGRESIGDLAKCLPAEDLVHAAQPGQCQDFSPDLLPDGRKESRELAKKCKPEKAATDWTADDVRSMHCAFTELGASERRQIPTDAMCEALGGTEDDLSQCMTESKGRPQDFDRMIARECSGGKLTQDTVKKLGAGAVQAPCDALGNMTVEDLTAVVMEMVDGLEEMEERGQRGRKGKASCVKVNELPLDVVIESKAMAQNIPLKDFKDKGGRSKDEFRDALGLDKGIVPDLPAHQNKLAFETMKGAESIEDMSGDEIRNLSSIVRGIPSSDIGHFNEAERLEILQHLCSYSDWSQKQSVALGDALEQALTDFNPTDPMLEMTTSMIDEMDDSCVTGLGKRLLNMTAESCRGVCERLGRADGLQCLMTIGRRRKIADICYQCLETNSTLSTTDVEVLGQLLPDVSLDLLDTIPASVLKDTAKLYSNIRCMTKNVSMMIQRKINTVIRSNDTSETLQDIGMWASGLDPEQIEIHKNHLGDIAGSITESMEPSPEDECCSRDWSTFDKGNIATTVDQRLDSIVQVILETADTADGGRRKRDTTPLSCTTLLSMGPGVTTISPDQISTLSEADFVDCLQTLGDQEGWDPDQLAALMDNFKQSIQSDLCSLSSFDLQTMGSIAYAMMESDVLCLTGLDVDATSNLGDLTGWTYTQKAAFASRYMSLGAVVEVSALVSVDVIALGHFLCGLSADDLASISPDVYGASSAAVGRVEGCSHAQLVSLALLAQAPDNHGPATDWTAAEYGDVGVVAAGVSGAELSQASVDDIEGWTEPAVQAMRISDLAMLSVEQLGSFSMGQAWSVNINGSEFNGDQRAAIVSARGVEEEDMADFLVPLPDVVTQISILDDFIDDLIEAGIETATEADDGNGSSVSGLKSTMLHIWLSVYLITMKLVNGLVTDS